MRRLVVGFVLAGLMVLPSLVIVEPAGATVPGENGRLVYVQDVPSQVSGVTAGEIYTMNPDGIRRAPPHERRRALGRNGRRVGRGRVDELRPAVVTR